MDKTFINTVNNLQRAKSAMGRISGSNALTLSKMKMNNVNNRIKLYLKQTIYYSLFWRLPILSVLAHILKSHWNNFN